MSHLTDLAAPVTLFSTGVHGLLSRTAGTRVVQVNSIGGYDLLIAWGMGGPFIICVPEQKLIVVATANADIGWDNNREYPIPELISNYILTAL